MTTRWGLRLICADSWLVAVHKPSGVPSVPARNPLDPPSVAEQLHASHGPLEAVHRLDRDIFDRQMDEIAKAGELNNSF